MKKCVIAMHKKWPQLESILTYAFGGIVGFFVGLFTTGFPIQSGVYFFELPWFRPMIILFVMGGLYLAFFSKEALLKKEKRTKSVHELESEKILRAYGARLREDMKTMPLEECAKHTRSFETDFGFKNWGKEGD